jgi:hypothetical protein
MGALGPSARHPCQMAAVVVVEMCVCVCICVCMYRTRLALVSLSPPLTHSHSHPRSDTHALLWCTQSFATHNRELESDDRAVVAFDTKRQRAELALGRHRVQNRSLRRLHGWESPHGRCALDERVDLLLHLLETEHVCPTTAVSHVQGSAIAQSQCHTNMQAAAPLHHLHTQARTTRQH